MSRHYRLNTQRLEFLHDFFKGMSLEFLHHRQKPAGLSPFTSSKVITAPANTMHLFSQVNHLEIGGESTHQQSGFRDTHSAEQLVQGCTRTGFTLTPVYRSTANGFNLLQEFRIFLLRQHISNQGSEYANIITQGFVFFRKVDFAHELSSTMKFWRG